MGGGRGVKKKRANVGERCEGMKAMAAAQGKYAPVMRAILKSAWGAIPLSRSAALLLLPCLPSLIASTLLLNLPLFFPPLSMPSFLRHSSLFILSLTVTVEPSSSFLTLGTRREISLAPEFREGSCRVSLSSLFISGSDRQHGPRLIHVACVVCIWDVLK